jgi:hypothetical protein
MWKISSQSLQGGQSMTNKIDEINLLLMDLTEDEKQSVADSLKNSMSVHPLCKEWNIDANTIISAIARSSDLTKRGVRGIIAEAVFDTKIIPSIHHASGWVKSEIAQEDLAYDALLHRDGIQARIQVKLQRLEKGKPKYFHTKIFGEKFYVVEVQKTRSGTKTEKGKDKVKKVKTRPYRFGEFDILAVNMHPSTGNWQEFRYTLSDWLFARKADKSLIEVMQPISETSNDDWTTDLNLCLDWFLLGKKKKIDGIPIKKQK